MMAEREISQSELARRVGVSQQTIFKLATGQTLNSRYLHLIARELGTTPAYLAGETENRESDTPDKPTFSREDLELLQRITGLSERARLALTMLLDELSPGRAPSVHANRHTYKAKSQGG